MIYRFDEIAINSTAKKKPVESDKFHYIGLEHIDSGTFEISRRENSNRFYCKLPMRIKIYNSKYKIQFFNCVFSYFLKAKCLQGQYY